MLLFSEMLPEPIA